MEIQGAGGVAGPNRVEPNRVTPQRTEATDARTSIGDRAEISEEARLLNKLSEVPDVRMDRVEELRKEIAAGNYETPERIEQAVDRLLEELAE